MKQYKGYKFRIYPTTEQENFFAKSFGCVRKIYNLLLEEKMNLYESKQTIKRSKPQHYFIEYPYLTEVDQTALLYAQRHLDKTFKKFTQKMSPGVPRFKSKSNPVQSYTTNNRNNEIKLVNQKYIKLPSIDSLIRIKLSRQPKGTLLSATVSKRSSGKYFISLLCHEEIQPLPKTHSAIGIDLGITDFAILSDGKKIDNNKFTSKMEQKLKREQRKLSRRRMLAKERGVYLYEAKNYQKQKRKVARLYEKVMNQRNDFLNKFSTYLIKNHDIICIEDLDTKDMMRNHKLAKSISDVSWSSFVEKLEYKARWTGRELIKVNRWFPSSQICSRCGYKDTKKHLDVRAWTCAVCHAHHDRDVNASINILKEGLRRRRIA